MAAPVSHSDIHLSLQNNDVVLSLQNRFTDSLFLWRWWIPDIREIIVFILIITVVIIWILLLHYSFVQAKVNKSRCAIEKQRFSNGGTYSVGSFDSYNNPMYTVTYDLSNKNYTHTCACQSGNNVNTFNIQVYDQKTNKTENIDKFCSCSQAFDTSDPSFSSYFRGYPGLINFMNNGDTSFFTNTIQ